MKKKFNICIMICLILSLLTGCNAAQMEQEVIAWNVATERTLSRYNTVKELSLTHSEALLNLVLYDKYSEELESLFKAHEEIESSDNGGGMPDYSFLEEIKMGSRTDGYDSYLHTFARVVGVPTNELYDNLVRYNEDPESVHQHFKNFLFNKVVVEEHRFFTSLNTPTVTEILRIRGESNSYVTVVILWNDNQIIGVDRSI